MNGRSLPPRVQIDALNRLQSGLTTVLVLVAVVALAFTATNVTMFAIQHEVSPWIAWLLDPMVAVALGAVLIVDGRLSEYGVNPSGWASVLRWFAGLGTWVMNCWGSLWPEGAAFGVPRQVDPAGLVLHSIPPVLLIVLAEAITHYRRAILDKIAELRAEVEAVDAPVESTPVPPVSTPVPAPPAPAPAPVPVPAAVEPSPLVICGDRRVYELTIPQASTSAEDEAAETEKLPADEALNVIRTCWVMGETITEAARKSTRSTSYVHKIYQRLRDQAAGPETTDHDHAREPVAV
ncbi:hypothetical protein JK364_32805 [Streptomyces sp. 110]|uniref:DUF2637 domain-containing protein n=1 Tax=Streptomyces endocoffeicus TaxID=2898945 RepID=A0ABS1PYQ6_9ACTN|nr:hypothetical protein [Streptomyces endocoffeicus]MBL1117130.1 hypothetical protein [Streptomyces endocoffeicus]